MATGGWEDKSRLSCVVVVDFQPMTLTLVPRPCRIHAQSMHISCLTHKAAKRIRFHHTSEGTRMETQHQAAVAAKAASVASPSPGVAHALCKVCDVATTQAKR